MFLPSLGPSWNRENREQETFVGSSPWIPLHLSVVRVMFLLALVTTSHNFFSPLLINKLYSSQSIVKMCSNSDFFQADVDNDGSDFDLNSLIEGDVDDDNYVSPRDEGARTPVVQSYYAPLKVRNFI